MGCNFLEYSFKLSPHKNSIIDSFTAVYSPAVLTYLKFLFIKVSERAENDFLS